MIELHDLTKRFGTVAALDGVALSVPEGTVQGLLGPNGAGKTTTVRIITTLLAADSGDAVVAGHSVRTSAARVRRSLGVSGQFAAVDEKLSGFENLTLVGELYGMRRRDAKARARELLRDFRLDSVSDRQRAATYSGGMKRRLDLAGAMVARPPVVVLDEPTTGLDPRGRRDTWDAIEGLATAGTTVLLTTQYLEEADRLADSIAVIDAGRIIAEGTATDLKTAAGGPVIDVVLARDRDGGNARAALAPLVAAGILGELDVDRRSARRLSAHAPRGGESLRAVLAALADPGSSGSPMLVAEAALRQPTLDDVFLRLTGDSDSGVATDHAVEPAADAARDRERVGTG